MRGGLHPHPGSSVARFVVGLTMMHSPSRGREGLRHVPAGSEVVPRVFLSASSPLREGLYQDVRAHGFFATEIRSRPVRLASPDLGQIR